MNENELNLLIDFCNQNYIPFLTNYPLSKLNTFRTGGKAKFIGLPETPIHTDLLERYAFSRNIEVFIIGQGSNLLVTDCDYKNILIKLNYPSKIIIEEKSENFCVIKAPASMKNSLFCKKVLEESLEGAEFLATIPGTLGGAVYQNAGCYGSEICDIIHGIEYSYEGVYHFEEKDRIFFTYRDSIFRKEKNRIIHEIHFILNHGKKDEIEKKLNFFREKRINTQPRNRKNAGSVFKNPDGKKAWQYIDKCHLKGKSIGGAMVSPDHANFILNTGQATSNDILNLIIEVQNEVLKKFNILLIPEVEFVGDFPALPRF